MKIFRAEKFQPRKRTTSSAPTQLRKTDWDVLMQYDRKTGKLDLKCKEFINDPASVKRLLEADMIDPTGRLTPKGKERTAKISRQFLKLKSAGPKVKATAKEKTSGDPQDKKPNQLKSPDPNLIVEDSSRSSSASETGTSDGDFKSAFKDPEVIQRITDLKKMFNGADLPPKSRKINSGNSKTLKTKSDKGYYVLRGASEFPAKDEPQNYTNSNQQPIKKRLSKKAVLIKDDEDLQVFFVNLPTTAPDSGSTPYEHLANESSGAQDLQAFFENLPADDSETPSKDDDPPRKPGK